MDKPEIVIVDDQPSLCREVCAFLGEEYIVHAFKAGKEALDYLEKNHSVRLILLDYHMPGMTGFEVLLQIRQIQAFSKTPIVFLTSETNERMQFEMMQRNATDYLTKPINAQKLKDCVRKNLAA